MRSILAIGGRLAMCNRLSFLLTALAVLCATSSGDTALSNGNYTWLLALLCPFFVVLYAFPKLLCLGASKRDFYLGSLVFYALLALGVSLLNTVFHLWIDPLSPARNVYNLMDVCGWTKNPVVVAALQQAGFLLLAELFLHALLLLQTRWYGWLIDAALVAVVSVFTPIAPLRALLADLFRLVLCNPNALTHVCACLLLSAALALASLWALKRKTL